MILQLNPPVPLETPKGAAFAHFLIDYGMETHLYWVCFITDTGECWTFDNTKIRVEKNISLGRTIDTRMNKENNIGSSFQ